MNLITVYFESIYKEPVYSEMISMLCFNSNLIHRFDSHLIEIQDITHEEFEEK